MQPSPAAGCPWAPPGDLLEAPEPLAPLSARLPRLLHSTQRRSRRERVPKFSGWPFPSGSALAWAAGAAVRSRWPEAPGWPAVSPCPRGAVPPVRLTLQGPPSWHHLGVPPGAECASWATASTAPPLPGKEPAQGSKGSAGLCACVQTWVSGLRVACSRPLSCSPGLPSGWGGGSCGPLYPLRPLCTASPPALCPARPGPCPGRGSRCGGAHLLRFHPSLTPEFWGACPLMSGNRCLRGFIEEGG